jgi:hypothetical protein
MIGFETVVAYNYFVKFCGRQFSGFYPAEPEVTPSGTGRHRIAVSVASDAAN